MLHHLSIAVSDLDRASAFYDAVLKPLGYTQVFADDEAVGYGYEGGDDKLCLKLAKHVMVPGEGFHLAFTATEPNQVPLRYATAGGTMAHQGPGQNMAIATMQPSFLIPRGIGLKQSST